MPKRANVLPSLCFQKNGFEIHVGKDLASLPPFSTTHTHDLNGQEKQKQRSSRIYSLPLLWARAPQENDTSRRTQESICRCQGYSSRAGIGRPEFIVLDSIEGYAISSDLLCNVVRCVGCLFTEMLCFLTVFCFALCVCVFYTRIQVAGQMGKSFVWFDFWVPDPYLIC